MTIIITDVSLRTLLSGYAYSQGLQENWLAVARGAGALVGISGTVRSNTYVPICHERGRKVLKTCTNR